MENSSSHHPDLPLYRAGVAYSLDYVSGASLSLGSKHGCALRDASLFMVVFKPRQNRIMDRAPIANAHEILGLRSPRTSSEMVGNLKCSSGDV